MKTKKHILNRIWIVLLVLTNHFCISQGTIRDYERATNFVSDTLNKYAYNRIIDFRGIEESLSFTYLKQTKRGAEFVIINPKEKTKKLAFDQDKFTKELVLKTGINYLPFSLPFKKIGFDKQLKSFSFSILQQDILYLLISWQLKLSLINEWQD